MLTRSLLFLMGAALASQVPHSVAAEGPVSVVPAPLEVHAAASCLSWGRKAEEEFAAPSVTPADVYRSFGWSPDGEKLLYRRSQDALPTGDLVIRSKTEIQRVGENYAHEATWSPDGHRVAYTFSSELEAAYPTGLAVVEIVSPSEAILVEPHGVLERPIAWDHATGLLYYYAIVEVSRPSSLAGAGAGTCLGVAQASRLELRAYDASTGRTRGVLPSEAVPQSLPQLEREARDGAFPFVVEAPDGAPVVRGDDYLGSSRLMATRQDGGVAVHLGEGSVMAVTADGVLVRSGGAGLQLIAWDGTVRGTADAGVSYGFPRKPGTVTQGGAGYPPPGNCNSGYSHYGTLAYAYDVANATARHVLASAAGSVASRHTTCQNGDPGCNSGWGNSVVIEHAPGEYTRYAHFAPGTIRVAIGQQVCAGLWIGDEGATGNVSGAHLHFQRQSSATGASEWVNFAEHANPLSCTSYSSVLTEVSSCAKNPPYYFDSSTEGWSAGNCMSPPQWAGNGTGVLFSDQLCDDGYLYAPPTSFAGGDDAAVNIQLLPQNGISDHDAQLFWGITANNETYPTAKVWYRRQNDWIVLNLDATSLAWSGQTVDALRLDFDTTNVSTRFQMNHFLVQKSPRYYFPANAQGWHPLYNTAVYWTNCCGWPDIMYVDQLGPDPHIESATFPYFFGAENDYLTVRLYPSGPTANHNMRVYFKKYPELYYSDTWSVPVDYVANGSWIDVNINLGRATGWSGSFINQLRLDFDPDGSSTGTRYHIDHIRLLHGTDLVPPAIAVTSPGNGSTVGPVVVASGTGEAGASVVVHRDGQVAGSTTVGGGGTWSVALGTLAAGQHSVYAVATDGFWNSSTSNTNVFTVDGSTSVAIATPAEDAILSGVVVVGGSSETPATVQLFLDGTPIASFASPGPWSRTVNGLAPGDHRLQAYVTDPYGNAAWSNIRAIRVVGLLRGPFASIDPVTPPMAQVCSLYPGDPSMDPAQYMEQEGYPSEGSWPHRGLDLTGVEPLVFYQLDVKSNSLTLRKAGSDLLVGHMLGQGLAGFSPFGPTAASWSPSRLDVFVTGTDNAIWHQWFDGGWFVWESLGGSLTSEPDAVWDGSSLWVFARGTDFALYYRRWQPSTGWQGWVGIGGGPWAGGFGVCSMSPGRVDVFARSTSNALWHIWYSGAWSNWETLGGTITSDPDATSMAPGRLDVFARGSDGTLQHIYWAGAWSSWYSLGGQLSSGPGVASWGNGRLDIFGRGVQGDLVHLWFDGATGWSTWESLRVAILGSPDAVSRGVGRLDVLVTGPDTQTRRYWFDGAGWH